MKAKFADWIRIENGKVAEQKLFYNSKKRSTVSMETFRPIILYNLCMITIKISSIERLVQMLTLKHE